MASNFCQRIFNISQDSTKHYQVNSFRIIPNLSRSKIQLDTNFSDKPEIILCNDLKLH
jgi:hypothetical protein